MRHLPRHRNNKVRGIREGVLLCALFGRRLHFAAAHSVRNQ